MSNHYHLLMETPEGNLSQVMQHINGSYTTYYNIKRKRAGHLFQGRYHAVLVEADAYALELSRYVHLNPVRAGIAERPEEHPWSSYSCYMNGRATPEWLHTDAILSYMGSKESEARNKYRQFVRDRLGSSYPSPLKEAAAGVILGRDAFVEKIRRKHLDGGKQDRNLPAQAVLTRRRSMGQIIEMVEGHITDKKLARKIGVHLCHRYSGERLRILGERFGLSESGITQKSRRLAQRAVKDEVLKKDLEEILEKLGLCNV